MKYSIIVPVYNRPDEVDELLDSLTRQVCNDFEVIIVEDGSANPCKQVCDKYADRLAIKYFMKPNSGPGQSRNYGVERASGDYVLILDSDVVVPEGYLQAVDDELRREPCQAFGGPDRAADSFTPTQKAISYSMTSFFTTGGIRGGKKKLDKFYPRSFNMGVRRDVYNELGGFSKMRFGEDIDFSIRIFKAGCRCRLFPGAWVYHKRRTDFRKFWRQVFNSGIARINLYKKYPESLKLVHLLPMVFTVGVFSSSPFSWPARSLPKLAANRWASRSALSPCRRSCSIPSSSSSTPVSTTTAYASACCPSVPRSPSSWAMAAASSRHGGNGACRARASLRPIRRIFINRVDLFSRR